MSLKTTFTLKKALLHHQKGEIGQAMALYEEAYQGGLNQPKPLLGYIILLIRDGQFAKAREMLVKLQNNPQLTGEQKMQLFVDYSVCCYKMGELDKGLGLLERQSAKMKNGLIYQTLGYLYVEKLDTERTPWAEPAAEETKPEEEAAAEQTPEEEIPAWKRHAAESAPKPETRDEMIQRVKAYLLEAIDYDDEDPICLDNYAQFLYRVTGDRTEARKWFEKAVEIKPGQIDSLWFLSRIDLEEGKKDAAVQRIEKLLEGRFSPLNFITKQEAEQELARLKA